MKKLVLTATLAAAAAAFAVPSTASGRWTENHFHVPQGENRLIHAEGTWQYPAPFFFSNIHCAQVTATIQLTGGTTTSHITQLTPIFATCTAQGGLAHCTVNAVTFEGLPWTGHAGSASITHPGVKKIQHHITGLLCPQTLQLETPESGSLVLQPVNTSEAGNQTTITALNLSSNMRATVGGTDRGIATLSGAFTLTPSDSHRYGWT